MEPEKTKEASVDETTKEQASTPEEQSIEKTFTQAELDDIIRREKAKAKRSAEKEYKFKMEEAEKLRQMNETQKAEYEAEQREKHIKDLEAKLNRIELEKEASKILSESNISVNDAILSFVVKDNAEDTKQAITAFSQVVDDLADKRVSEMLKGKTPSRTGTSTTAGVTKEQFNRMGYASRNELLQNNPELYKQLKG